MRHAASYGAPFHVEGSLLGTREDTDYRLQSGPTKGAPVTEPN